MDLVITMRNFVAMCYEAERVLLAYLPPYSPDFNPIGTSFSILLKHTASADMKCLISYYTKENGDGEDLLDFYMVQLGGNSQ